MGRAPMAGEPRDRGSPGDPHAAAAATGHLQSHHCTIAPLHLGHLCILRTFASWAPWHHMLLCDREDNFAVVKVTEQDGALLLAAPYHQPFFGKGLVIRKAKRQSQQPQPPHMQHGHPSEAHIHIFASWHFRILAYLEFLMCFFANHILASWEVHFAYLHLFPRIQAGAWRDFHELRRQQHQQRQQQQQMQQMAQWLADEAELQEMDQQMVTPH